MSSLRSSIDFRRRIELFKSRLWPNTREQNVHHVKACELLTLAHHRGERLGTATLSFSPFYYAFTLF
jgi:RNA 3'-terminal phosphate cyclase